MPQALDLILLVGSMPLKTEDLSMQWAISKISTLVTLSITIMFMKNIVEANHITFHHTTDLKEDIDDTSLM